MITAVGRDQGQGFSEAPLRNFPCDELLTIDRLWVKHSNGLYGFSIQKQIYVECGGKLQVSYTRNDNEIWTKFSDRIAWHSPQSYSQDNFMYVKGHIPRLVVLEV